MSSLSKTILVLALVLSGTVVIVCPTASAQRLEPVSGPGGAGYFSVGPTYLTTIGDLNDALRRAGYPESNRFAFTVGGGGYGILRSGLMLGGEGFGLIVPNERTNAREVNYAAGMGFFTIGYQYVNLDGQLVAYPFLGIGGGGASLGFDHAETETFRDVLSNPNRGATLVQGVLLLQIGGGIELRGAQTAQNGGPFVGLRAGYIFTPISGDWSFDEGDELRGGPDAGPSGLYVRLVIGGGGPQRVTN